MCGVDIKWKRRYGQPQVVTFDRFCTVLQGHLNQRQMDGLGQRDSFAGANSAPRTLMMVATTAAASGVCHDRPPAAPAPGHPRPVGHPRPDLPHHRFLGPRHRRPDHPINHSAQRPGITEQGEAMTLMIHHLHAMGSAKCQPLLNPPRHVFEPTESVAREFRNKSLLAIKKDLGDEVIGPTI